MIHLTLKSEKFYYHKAHENIKKIDEITTDNCQLITRNLNMRTETDLLGSKEIPADALYGIHTARAVENFPLTGRNIHPALIHGFGSVKLAAATTNKTINSNWLPDIFPYLETACIELIEGKLDKHIIVDALQGGAGTSTNMNVNEVLANRTLELAGKEKGSYNIIHPLEDINLHQSTNDTYPTALKIAAINELRILEKELINLLEAFQNKEKETADVVKVGRTQLQDAVLTTMGRTMSSYAEAFSRDRWRIFKCEERLRVVNLGGTAIGTGLTAPKKYIFNVVNNLKQITGIGLARAENLVECTQNNDAFVEVSGILNACASNLLKVCSDLRLMSSGPHAGLGEINLPPRQAGSSLMPGKVNPVIPEAVSQAAINIMANNSIIAQACSAGNLELNAFMPLIADKLLESITLLSNSCHILAEYCIKGITVNRKNCQEHVNGATAILTALVDTIGYEQAQKIAKNAEEKNIPIKKLILEQNTLTKEELKQLISPEAVTKLGSS